MLCVAYTEGERDPAARHHVKGGDRLSQHDWVVIRQHDHTRVDPDAGGGPGDEGHDRKGMRPMCTHGPGEVVGHHGLEGDILMLSAP